MRKLFFFFAVLLLLLVSCQIQEVNAPTEQTSGAKVTRISQRMFPSGYNVYLIEFEGHRYMALYNGGIIKLD